jgi:hypothetical protein
MENILKLFGAKTKTWKACLQAQKLDQGCHSHGEESKVSQVRPRGSDHTSDRVPTNCQSIHKALNEKCYPYKKRLSRTIQPSSQMLALQTCQKESWEHEQVAMEQEKKLQMWIQEALQAVKESEFRDDRDKKDMTNELQTVLHPNWPTKTQDIHSQCTQLNAFVKNEINLLLQFIQSLKLKLQDDFTRFQLLSEAYTYLDKHKLLDYGSHLVPFSIGELTMFYRHLKHFALP